MRKETGINGISLSLVVFELFFPAQFRNKAQRTSQRLREEMKNTMVCMKDMKSNMVQSSGI
jgi:hypothetical protein